MPSGASLLSPDQAAERLLATIVRPARLLIAISGGSDSAGLLLSLIKGNTAGSDVSIDAVTIDHALRPESADEAVAVATLCKRLGIRHFIRRWEGEKPKSGISAASRETRYRLLMEVADELDATAILTGHTFDDQAETVAMRAARDEGEGNLGLAGMADAVLLDRRRWLLRPFLRTRRADIRAFLGEAGEGWIDDPSNLNPRYERVRVRDRLSQEEAFDGEAAVRAALRRSELSDAAALWVRDCLTIRQGVLAHISPAGSAGDPSVRRHALAALTAVLGGRQYLPGRESMDRVMAFIDGGQPGRLTASRVIFDLRRDGLYMVRENRGMMPLHVAPGGMAIWDGRYRIANGEEDEIVVGPTAPDRQDAVALFPGVPPTVAMRATTAMPCVELVASAHRLPKSEHVSIGFETVRHSEPFLLRRAEGRPAGGRGFASGHIPNISRVEPRVSTRPYGYPQGEGAPRAASLKNRILLSSILGPFDCFLPQFDLRLAREFAVLLGCDVFPLPPVKDCGRKS